MQNIMSTVSKTSNQVNPADLQALAFFFSFLKSCEIFWFLQVWAAKHFIKEVRVNKRIKAVLEWSGATAKWNMLPITAMAVEA